MSQSHSRFLIDSANKSFDLQHREIMAHHVLVHEEAMAFSLEQFSNLELARKRAGVQRHMVLEHLEEHLKTFEQNFSQNGGQIIWAEDAAEARRAILELLEQNEVKTVVKARSMVVEEIGLFPFLEKSGIDCLESDLASLLLQLSGDRPYHMANPVMHLTNEEVVDRIRTKFTIPENASLSEVMAQVNNRLQKNIVQAEAGITGANFLVADTGSVVLSENEGNGLLTASMPRIHVVVAGIEKLLASVYDLDLFWPLLATHASGQPITAFNTLLSGPRAPDERDGPSKMVVVLLDNGRSRLLNAVPQRRALACIKCGACQYVCPVYRSIGGHAYGTVYSGPIGAVISPFLTGRFEEYKHLSFASTLCGRCTEVCPVGIDLHQQLIMNRRLSVKKGYTSRAERWAMWAYKVAMKKRKRLDSYAPKRKNYLFRKFVAKAWGDRRERPMFVKSFASRYK